MYDMRRNRPQENGEYLVENVGGAMKEQTFSKSRLITPIIIALVVVIFVAVMFGGSSGTVKEDQSEYRGKAKKPLVIIDREWFRIPNTDGKQLHYITGGEADPLYLLIHGQSRRFQDSRHWAAHYDLFDTLGTFCAVDLLGHGQSDPGEQVSVFQQAEYVKQLVDTDFAIHRHVVIVARGWGVNVGLEVAKHLNTRLSGMIFIAPEVEDLIYDTIPNYVVDKPMFLVWAKDDPVSDFAEHTKYLDIFSKSDTYFIDQAAEVGIHKMVANTPENIRIFEFQNQVHDWVSRQRLLNV